MKSTIILMLIIASFSSTGDYVSDLQKHRDDKNKEFKDKTESPIISKRERKRFSGIKFFPVDQNYIVKANFYKNDEEDVLKMETSSSAIKTYIKYGELHFNLKGKDHVLIVYQSLKLREMEEYKDYLFLPFTDESSGSRSYGGGRYIDLKLPLEDVVTIDFNYNYNPYCAYTDGYSCPIPPKENHLNIEILAGEMAYK